MFNRSKKYIMLLILNIVIIVAWYAQKDETNREVFDTQFVIELIDRNDKNEKALNEAQARAVELNEEIAKLRPANNLLAAKGVEIAQLVQQCAQEKSILNSQLDLALADSQNKPSSSFSACPDEIQQLDRVQRQLTASQQRIDELIDENALLRRDIVLAKQQVEDAKNDPEIARLRARIEKLENDIENPIDLQSLYISDRQCEHSRFESMACIEEFLLRPKFSKTPQGLVRVNILSPTKQVIASQSFSSKRAQLLRVKMSGPTELPVGEYTAEFEVDGETLTGDAYLLARR